MIYPYICPVCLHEEDVWKFSKDASRPEPCPACGTIMRRVYTVPSVAIPQTQGYNPGLGCPSRDSRSRARELGAESWERMDGNKPKRKDYLKSIDRNVLNQVVDHD